MHSLFIINGGEGKVEIYLHFDRANHLYSRGDSSPPTLFIKMKHQRKPKIILYFTLLRPVVKSVGFILLGSFCILIFAFCIGASGANAASASLYLSPSTGNFTVGENFSIAVKVNTGGAAINAAEAVLSFASDLGRFEVASISKANSIFTVWTKEPVFSNSSGTVNFGGGAPNPGFTGASGTIITITFLAKITGTGTANFTSGAILANDGKGTNILTSMVGGTYTLQPKIVTPPAEPFDETQGKKPPAEKPLVPGALPSAPVISSSTHPDQEKWYKNNEPQFSWDLPQDITGVSFKFDKNPEGISGNISDGLLKSKSFKNVEDGIWYFHLKLRNRTGWGKISRYIVQIDTEPPEPFEITVKEGKETTCPTPTLLFDAKDKTSGIEYYEVKIGEGDIFPIELEDLKHNPFKMSPQAPGKHTIVVKAVDKAGNFTLAMEEIETLTIKSPEIIEYPRRIEESQIITIQGTSLSKCLISIYYQEEEEVLKLVTKANSAGFWEYVFTKPLKQGVYNFWAEAMDENGAISKPSKKITILVQPPAFLRIGKLAIDYLTTIITILILTALIIFGAFWSWQKARKYRDSLKKETREAEESLHKAMDALRGEIEEKLGALQKIKTERALTEEEKKIEKELKENLSVAEKYIAKEIKDIEERL